MLVVGMISGTSADGIDVALAEISGTVESGIGIEQVAFETIPWQQDDHALIVKLFSDSGTTAEVCRANFQLGERFADAVLAVLDSANVQATDVSLIGSHGQTVWHDVAVDDLDTLAPSLSTVTSTLQIGEPSVIAATTGITTVANFRTADVAAGGQGAPLVSILDWLMLRPPPGMNGVEDGWRAVQNIGGMGNVTFLPPVGLDAEPLAFDTGPGNVLIDWAVVYATDGQQSYDLDGRIASIALTNSELVEKWLAHPYFQQLPPKTTGRELFNEELFQQWQADATALGLSDAELIATLTELTAASIAHAYAQFAPGPIAQVVVAGGGVHNLSLMGRLRNQLQNRLGGDVEICEHNMLGIDSDAKEALVFALLAYLTLQGYPGNVPPCTGASGPQILGQIAPGKNFREFLLNLV